MSEEIVELNEEDTEKRESVESESDELQKQQKSKQRKSALARARLRRNKRRLTRVIDSNPLYLLVTKFGKYSGFLLFLLFTANALFPTLIPIQSLWSWVATMLTLGVTASLMKTIVVMKKYSSFWMRGPKTDFGPDTFDAVMQHPMVSWIYNSLGMAGAGILGITLFNGGIFTSISPIIISLVIGGFGGLVIEVGKRVHANKQENQLIATEDDENGKNIDELVDSLNQDPGKGMRLLMATLKAPLYITPRQLGWMFAITLYAVRNIENIEAQERFLTTLYWTVGSLLTANHFLEELPNTRYRAPAERVLSGMLLEESTEPPELYDEGERIDKPKSGYSRREILEKLTACCGAMTCICGRCGKRADYEEIKNPPEEEGEKDDNNFSLRDKLKNCGDGCSAFFSGAPGKLKAVFTSCCGKISCDCLNRRETVEEPLIRSDSKTELDS